MRKSVVSSAICEESLSSRDWRSCSAASLNRPRHVARRAKSAIALERARATVCGQAYFTSPDREEGSYNPPAIQRMTGISFPLCVFSFIRIRIATVSSSNSENQGRPAHRISRAVEQAAHAVDVARWPRRQHASDATSVFCTSRSGRESREGGAACPHVTSSAPERLVSSVA
jgi:hypothetical protein